MKLLRLLLKLALLALVFSLVALTTVGAACGALIWGASGNHSGMGILGVLALVALGCILLLGLLFTLFPSRAKETPPGNMDSSNSENDI